MTIPEYDKLLAQRCRQLASKLGRDAKAKGYLLSLARRLDGGVQAEDVEGEAAFAGSKPSLGGGTAPPPANDTERSD